MMLLLFNLFDLFAVFRRDRPRKEFPRRTTSQIAVLAADQVMPKNCLPGLHRSCHPGVGQSLLALTADTSSSCRAN